MTARMRGCGGSSGFCPMVRTGNPYRRRRAAIFFHCLRRTYQRANVKGIAGKRVFISAGAGGIGRAIADRFLRAGARVHVCDVDDAALAELTDIGEGLSGTRADVANWDHLKEAFAEAARVLGGLDVLVNNAGIPGPTASAEEISPAGLAAHDRRKI